MEKKSLIVSRSFLNFSNLSDGIAVFYLALVLSEIIRWLKFRIVLHLRENRRARILNIPSIESQVWGTH